MAYSVTVKCYLLAMALVGISFSCCNLGKAAEDHDREYDDPQTGNGGSGGVGGFGSVGGGGVGGDPAQIVAKALLCFNDKYIYSNCEESCRLTESGNLDVHPEYVDQYCNGPCLSETHLVLNCIEDILTNFIFYNRATIHDIRGTIKAACSYGPERGDFNVAEHIEAEENNSHKAAYNHKILFGLGLVIIARVLLVG